MIKKQRIDYWCCSKFADFIRGEKKPFALELGKWNDWRDDLKKRKPIRYWFCEKFLNKIQDFLMFPFDVYHTLDVYISNRFISKIHYLKTGLKVGEYYDLDHRILYGLFNEFVEFIEKDYARMASYGKKNKYKFKNGRCPEAGVDYLNWAIGLKYGQDDWVPESDKLYGQPTSQAKAAKKILELYNWWKSRDNRPDPFDIFSEEKDGKNYYKKINKMEERYEKEDTKMLIELIKLRGSLWT